MIFLVQVFGGPANPSGGEVLATVEIHGQPAEVHAEGEAGMAVTWENGDDGISLIAYDTGPSLEPFVAMANEVSVPLP